MQTELARIKTRREYLERADREYASFSSTTKTVMENRSLWDDHVVGALGELLHVPPKYTAAAEVALGRSVSNIVTDTSQAAQTVISWLKKNNFGRTTFYPLDAMRLRGSDAAEREASKEKGICGIAADLFGYDEEFIDLMSAILGRTLIAEDLDTARTVAKKYNYRLRIVTLDGQLVNPGGSMTGGSMKKQENTYFGPQKRNQRSDEKRKRRGKIAS